MWPIASNSRTIICPARIDTLTTKLKFAWCLQSKNTLWGETFTSSGYHWICRAVRKMNRDIWGTRSVEFHPVCGLRGISASWQFRGGWGNVILVAWFWVSDVVSLCCLLIMSCSARRRVCTVTQHCRIFCRVDDSFDLALPRCLASMPCLKAVRGHSCFCITLTPTKKKMASFR